MGDTKAGAYGLAACGLANLGRQTWHPDEAALAARAAAEGDPGPPLTGDDRFVVQSLATGDRVAWSEHNRPFSPTTASLLWRRAQAALQGRDVFVVEGFAGRDEDERTAVRVVAQRASDARHAAGFLRPAADGERAALLPDLTVLVASGMQASPEIDGTAGRRFGILDPDRSLVLLGGPMAPSEVTDAVAKAVGFMRSREGVVAFPAVACDGASGTALFVGLPGTGRTTLAAGLGEITADGPILWTGSGIEPLGPGRMTTHPAHVAIVVADAGGTLPALARLTPEEAALWFALGYAAVRDGVASGEAAEAGMAFSPCCGARHHVLPAAVVADRFLAKLRRHKPTCWLVDTGWPGGGAGRRPASDTIAVLAEAFAGRLVGGRRDPVFGFEVPTGVVAGSSPDADLARRVVDAAARIRGLGAEVRGVLPDLPAG